MRSRFETLAGVSFILMLQITSSIDLNIFLENLLFLAIATSFLVYAGKQWRGSKPFSIPQPLPPWFKTWLNIVLVVGVAVPLLALVLWGGWWSHKSVVRSLVPYFAILGFQILSEIVTLRRFKSCVWVMIPCVYLPYRIWQLHTGAILIGFDREPVLVQRLLYIEILLWIFNYGVHLSQIPRLLRWELLQSDSISYQSSIASAQFSGLRQTDEPHNSNLL